MSLASASLAPSCITDYTAAQSDYQLWEERVHNQREKLSSLEKHKAHLRDDDSLGVAPALQAHQWSRRLNLERQLLTLQNKLLSTRSRLDLLKSETAEQFSNISNSRYNAAKLKKKGQWIALKAQRTASLAMQTRQQREAEEEEVEAFQHKLRGLKRKSRILAIKFEKQMKRFQSIPDPFGHPRVQHDSPRHAKQQHRQTRIASPSPSPSPSPRLSSPGSHPVTSLTVFSASARGTSFPAQKFVCRAVLAAQVLDKQHRLLEATRSKSIEGLQGQLQATYKKRQEAQQTILRASARYYETLKERDALKKIIAVRRGKIREDESTVSEHKAAQKSRKEGAEAANVRARDDLQKLRLVCKVVAMSLKHIHAQVNPARSHEYRHHAGVPFEDFQEVLSSIESRVRALSNAYVKRFPPNSSPSHARPKERRSSLVLPEIPTAKGVHDDLGDGDGDSTVHTDDTQSLSTRGPLRNRNRRPRLKAAAMAVRTIQHVSSIRSLDSLEQRLGVVRANMRRQASSESMENDTVASAETKSVAPPEQDPLPRRSGSEAPRKGQPLHVQKYRTHFAKKRRKKHGK